MMSELHLWDGNVETVSTKPVNLKPFDVVSICGYTDPYNDTFFVIKKFGNQYQLSNGEWYTTDSSDREYIGVKLVNTDEERVRLKSGCALPTKEDLVKYRYCNRKALEGIIERKESLAKRRYVAAFYNEFKGGILAD